MKRDLNACTRCGKPRDYFTGGNLMPQCQECRRTMFRTWYQENCRRKTKTVKKCIVCGDEFETIFDRAKACPRHKGNPVEAFQQRAREARKRSQQPLLCKDCGGPRPEGRRYCDGCKQKREEHGRVRRLLAQQQQPFSRRDCACGQNKPKGKHRCDECRGAKAMTRPRSSCWREWYQINRERAIETATYHTRKVRELVAMAAKNGLLPSRAHGEKLSVYQARGYRALKKIALAQLQHYEVKNERD